MLVAARITSAEGENEFLVSLFKNTSPFCFHPPELAMIANFYLKFHFLQRRNISFASLLIKFDPSQVDLRSFLRHPFSAELFPHAQRLELWPQFVSNLLHVCAAKKRFLRAAPMACLDIVGCVSHLLPHRNMCHFKHPHLPISACLVRSIAAEFNLWKLPKSRKMETCPAAAEDVEKRSDSTILLSTRLGKAFRVKSRMIRRARSKPTKSRRKSCGPRILTREVCILFSTASQTESLALFRDTMHTYQTARAEGFGTQVCRSILGNRCGSKLSPCPLPRSTNWRIQFEVRCIGIKPRASETKQVSSEAYGQVENE